MSLCEILIHDSDDTNKCLLGLVALLLEEDRQDLTEDGLHENAALSIVERWFMLCFNYPLRLYTFRTLLLGGIS